MGEHEKDNIKWKIDENYKNKSQYAREKEKLEKN